MSCQAGLANKRLVHDRAQCLAPLGTVLGSTAASRSAGDRRAPAPRHVSTTSIASFSLTIYPQVEILSMSRSRNPKQLTFESAQLTPGLVQLDAVEWLRSLPKESIDLILTDPPYESLEKHRAIGTTTRLKHSKASSNDWFAIFENARFPELFRECFRVLRPNRHFYLFCDAETMFVAKPMAEAAGFRFWKPLVWDKKRIGMGYHYRSRYEFILFFEKGKRKLNDLGIADVLEAPRIVNGYPTEKPTSICEIVIAQSTTPGELVADPFFGSGSTLVAAARLGRRFCGSDTCAEALSVTIARIQGLEAHPAGAPESPSR